MPIHKITVDNWMKIRHAVVEFDPENGEITFITGKNGSGNTSLFHALRSALGGKRFVPQEPVRRGAAQAEVAVIDDKYITELVVKPDRSTETTLRSADGVQKFKKPAQLLGEFYHDIGFDVGQFVDMKPQERREAFRKLLGLDFDELDGKRQAAFDERTIVKRKADELTAQLRELPKVEAPDKETSVSELSAKLTARTKKNGERATAHILVLSCHQRVIELEDQLTAAENEVEKAEESEAAHGDGEDIAPIEKAMSEAENTNRNVRQNTERATKVAELEAAEKKAGEFTDAIKKVDADKQLMIEAADMPIEGVAFGDDDITYNGLPFSQASHSDQLEISAAISAAINPSGLALIEHGEKFDSEHRKALARALGGKQAIMEIATDGEPIGIVFEDGEVVTHQ